MILQRRVYVLLYKDYDNAEYETMAASFDESLIQEMCLAFAQEYQYEMFYDNYMFRHFPLESAMEYTPELKDSCFYVEEVLLYGG